MAMAFSSKLQLLLFISVSLIPISLSSNPIHPLSTLNTTTPDVHDLLTSYNLPKGLIPENVKSYSLNSDENSFTVELTRGCYVHLTDMFYYDTILTGKLSSGKISNITGIQERKFFIWVPVTGVQVNERLKRLEFQVGLLTEIFAVSTFQEIPSCSNFELQQSLLASK